MTTETLQPAEAAAQPPQPRGQHGRWEPSASDILPMSLSRAAKLSAIDKATLHKILSGKRRARLDQAVAIADTIGMPLAEFANYLMSRPTAA